MSVGTVLTAISLLKDAAPYLGKLAEKFLNGEITKDELEFKSKSEDLSAEVQLALAQIMLNKEEAKSPHFFVAGWRPFVGWSAALGFCMRTIVFPLLQFFLPESPVPMLDSELVLITLGGLLGMGSLRTYEKYKGVERKRLDDY